MSQNENTILNYQSQLNSQEASNHFTEKNSIQNVVIQQMNDNQINSLVKCKKFEYKKLNNSTKQDNYCYSFAFNKNNSILIVGQYSGKIIVFCFNNKKKIISILSTDLSISCLTFMKKSDSFVSGCDNSTIVTWKKIKNNQWEPYQTLEGHSSWIHVMIINKDEDLLISGSSDKTIKFWKLDQQQWKCLQTINVSYQVFSLSLNISETKLISCGFRSDISLIELTSDKDWIITKKVEVDHWGYRLCFLSDNQFIFQSLVGYILEEFNYDQIYKEFIKINQIEINSCYDKWCYFQCQFIQSKNILVVKHGNYINLFRQDQNENLAIIQQIEFQDDSLYGFLTEDGNFLITWEGDPFGTGNGSRQIQVRKLLVQE